MARGDLRAARERNAAGLITGRELRTFAAESAARTQQALLLFEGDEFDVLLPQVHAIMTGQPPSAWSAVIDAPRLRRRATAVRSLTASDTT